MLKITQPLIVAAILALPLSAQATTQNFSWTLNKANCANTTDGCSTAAARNSYEFKKTTGTVANNVTVSGFSTTNDLKTTNGVITSSSTDVAGDTTQDGFETAQVQMWDGYGLGVTSKEETNTAPHHAFDNDGGNATNGTTPDELSDGGDVDAALFSFANAINLNSITIGWTNGSADEASSTRNDVDISILAYTGSGTPSDIATTATSSGTVNNKTFTSLLANGWSFVGHYSNLIGNGTTAISNGTAISSNITNATTSKYWLISAYSSFADGNGSDANLDFGNDYFKIAGLGGTKAADPTTTDVPEPASFVLVGLGLMGWRMTRRNAYVTAKNFA